jgi:hypothetical protein
MSNYTEHPKIHSIIPDKQQAMPAIRCNMATWIDYCLLVLDNIVNGIDNVHPSCSKYPVVEDHYLNYTPEAAQYVMKKIRELR